MNEYLPGQMDSLNTVAALVFFVLLLLWLFGGKYRQYKNKTPPSILVPEKSSVTVPINKRRIGDINKNQFQFVDERVTENLFVYSPIAILGPVTAKIVVQNRGALLLYGVATENLVVNPGGSAVIYGTVVGEVVNNGGELHIYGKVLGPLSRLDGDTQVYSTAQILCEQALAEHQN